MKLLYSNDKPGQHAPSWYNATTETQRHAPLETHVRSQVCIIGAGYTGLSAALELRNHGVDCVVLDAHRVGWGASGRNGGQLGTGFNMNQIELAALLGQDCAKALWQSAEQAKTWIHSTSKKYGFEIDYQPGIVYAQHRKSAAGAERHYCDYLHQQYGYDAMQPLDAHTIKQHVASDNYYGGALDTGAGHIHALKLAKGLGSAALHEGAEIFERSEVIRIENRSGSTAQRVVTASGSVVCDNVIIATNGYVDALDKQIHQRLMPINNFIVVTEPLGTLAAQLLPHNDAVADSRFVVNYFRRVSGDRLLFGGGENYSYQFPQAIAPLVRKAMLQIFPDLNNAAIDYAWGGTLAITRNRLPFIGEIAARRFTAGGYSGHGVALACLYGRALAEHLSGDSVLYELLKKLPNKRFPGGMRSRSALLAMAMTGYSWLDRW